ncbi:unnamed protein product [Penicillium egyptiacum]|uniref:Zn(2)-C6 fungal-type domain-containing protein n=1 Tax=Penicillium egyptiacum TaxID=1303716 RepID=A0A9W4K7J4_9EURO|nr:unnamed protein product [Penicillium egyptiacum]
MPSQGRREHIDQEPSQSSALLQIPHDPPIYGQMKGTLCGRISQWLWSGWRGTAFEAASPDLPKPYQPNPADCKACREHHTACDHTKPQCSHCWSQQLLCFYVEPIQKKRKDHRKATVSEVETVSRLIKDATV